MAICLAARADDRKISVRGPDGKMHTVSKDSPNPSAVKPDEKKEGDDGNKADDKKEESAEPKVIRRDTNQDEHADPNELKSLLGEDGRVAFQFRNQPWVDLVQWLADISDQPLDWLELPGDRVNMRSPGRYTVEETRDLFNRYLLARGYTLLEIDGGLTVAKTENINPAIVPRIEPSGLQTLPMHSFVRTSMDVGWLSAEKLSEELKPMISSNGRLTALTTTNRIEAMDAAVNLRQVLELLERERDQASREALAPEFKLRFLPAEEAKMMLEQFLGVEKKESRPLTPQEIQMMQQMRNQNKGQPQKEEKVEISIVANARQNSIIIRAPVDRIAVATEFLRRIDVPSDSILSLSDVQSRVQVFRLASLDPEKLIEIVTEMNVLEPTTRVRVDKDNNALIVAGSMADRFIINSLIERLDGSGRQFEVLPLRRLDAGEVAESIAFLMGKKDDKKDSSSRRSYYYGYGRGEEKEKEKDEFRVAANTRNRQVLLWANKHEMEEVRSLLVKLGELPPPGGNAQTIRMLDASATPETYEYLRRLREHWNRISPNPLELPDGDEFQDPNASRLLEEEEKQEQQKEKEEPSGNEDPIDDENIANEIDSATRLAMFQNEVVADNQPQLNEDIQSAEDFDRAFGNKNNELAKPESEQGNRHPEPIRIELDSDGNLVLISPDTGALDQLENLMLQMTPPKRPYKVFHIEHASASWTRLNLEEYFKDLDEEEDADTDSFYYWYFGGGDDKEEKPSGLGKGNQLRFVDDIDTNTLVVSGATTSQLRTISELIELWDVPEPVNKRKTRFTRLVPIEFGKADTIAETVKEAYRDLLSSNDKTFAAGGKAQNEDANGKKVSKSRDGNGSELQNSESGRNGGSADFSFKGKLSIGIDAIGNTLLVSAEGEPLLELVADMIRQLDEAAKPQGEIQVVELSGNMNSESLRDALRALGASEISSAGSGESGKDKKKSDQKRN